MNEQPDINKDQKDSELQQKLEHEYENVRARIGDIFDRSTDPGERLELLTRGVKEGARLLGMEASEIEDAFKECVVLNDRNEFIERIFTLVKPISDIKITDQVRYETVAREGFVEQGGFTPINQLLSYGVAGDALHIHVAPNRTTSLRDKLSLMRDGMQRLAEIVRDDVHIEKVTGTSPLVAEHASLMEKLGFTVHGEISDEFRRKRFSGETKPISHMEISRDELLKRYLNDK